MCGGAGREGLLTWEVLRGLGGLEGSWANLGDWGSFDLAKLVALDHQQKKWMRLYSTAMQNHLCWVIPLAQTPNATILRWGYQHVGM